LFCFGIAVGVAANGVHSSGREDSTAATVNDVKPSSSPAPPRKLGFGLVGAGRRATVPSVFTQEDEETTPDASKLRTLVPIDYSAEEMQVVSTVASVPVPPPAPGGLAHNLAAAAEFAKSLSLSSGKDENDKDRSRRSRDKTSDRDRSRKDKERDRDREKEKDRDRDRDRDRERSRDRPSKADSKAPETKKIMDAKQLIDTIPKSKEELFNYPVDWNIYDTVRSFVNCSMSAMRTYSL
jgi:RNA-binding protein 25